MANPLLGIITGALFTGLVQLSAATVSIAIALASEGFLSLEAGIALALGELAELGEEEIGINYTKSDATKRLTEGLYLCLHHAISSFCTAIRDNDPEAAKDVLDLEPHINKLQHDLMVRKSQRLGSSSQEALAIARVEISVANKLQRMYSLSKQIAGEILSESLKS